MKPYSPCSLLFQQLHFHVPLRKMVKKKINLNVCVILGCVSMDTMGLNTIHNAL